jgi:hypothetical protein
VGRYNFSYVRVTLSKFTNKPVLNEFPDPPASTSVREPTERGCVRSAESVTGMGPVEVENGEQRGHFGERCTGESGIIVVQYTNVSLNVLVEPVPL